MQHKFTVVNTLILANIRQTLTLIVLMRFSNHEQFICVNYNAFPNNLFKFQVAKNLEPEQAKRIFEACDAVGGFGNIHEFEYICQNYFEYFRVEINKSVSTSFAPWQT